MDDDIYILEDRPVPVSFANKFDAFFKGGRGILGTPVEAFLRLIGVRGDRRIEIEKVEDLEGQVSITTPAEALEFVRLFSSFDTHYLFPKMQYVEPTATDYETKKDQLEPPRVVPERDGFLITRNLVDAKGRLIKATEQVSTDGAYELLDAEVIDEHSPVAYPLYQ